jgi:hypothetical protein
MLPWRELTPSALHGYAQARASRAQALRAEESARGDAVVAEACGRAGMAISSAYAARRRSPVFAAAWDAALSIARERLADTLLARSIERRLTGTLEMQPPRADPLSSIDKSAS